MTEEADRPKRRMALAFTLIWGLLVVCALGGAWLWPRFALVRPSEDKFSEIARRVYGDECLWLPLARANPGVVEIRSWRVIRTPFKKDAERWLRAYCEKRGIPFDPEETRSNARDGYISYPVLVHVEHWVAEEFESESPDGRILLFDYRYIDEPGHWFQLVLADNLTHKKISMWNFMADSSEVLMRWRGDSRRAIVSLRTDRNTYPTEGGVNDMQPYGCILVDVTDQGAEANFVEIKRGLAAEEIEALLDLPLPEICRRLGVAVPEGPVTPLQVER